MKKPKAIFTGVIVLYFMIGFEIMIMISPMAGVFYAAFNPVFDWLDQSQATHWLTAFFLPHTVSPPDLLLKIIRITGSVLFVLGTLIFFVCAGQVYYKKFTGQGAVQRRHPCSIHRHLG